MNYYHRDNEGNWYIISSDIIPFGKEKRDIKTYMKPVEYSGSMETSYQMGIQACYSPKKQNVHLDLALFHAQECEKELEALKEHNDNLKERLDSQCKPSESLREWMNA